MKIFNVTTGIITITLLLVVFSLPVSAQGVVDEKAAVIEIPQTVPKQKDNHNFEIIGVALIIFTVFIVKYFRDDDNPKK